MKSMLLGLFGAIGTLVISQSGHAGQIEGHSLSPDFKTCQNSWERGSMESFECKLTFPFALNTGDQILEIRPDELSTYECRFEFHVSSSGYRVVARPREALKPAQFSQSKVERCFKAAESDWEKNRLEMIVLVSRKTS